MEEWVNETQIEGSPTLFPCMVKYSAVLFKGFVSQLHCKRVMKKTCEHLNASRELTSGVQGQFVHGCKEKFWLVMLVCTMESDGRPAKGGKILGPTIIIIIDHRKY